MRLVEETEARQAARLDKVGRSDKLRRNTGKGTPVTAELD